MEGSGYHDKCLSYIGVESLRPAVAATPQFFATEHSLPEETQTLHSRLTRDWNEEFQTLLEESHTESKQELRRVKDIRKLCEEFAAHATAIGQTIISELSLPVHLKTIKPITRMAGGVAGGAKFFHEDIFFKFPVDVNNLYGGEEGLMKACGHELKGLMSYIDCRIRGLCFPLMVIIDYRGWRLIAESVLPLDKSTIVYGTCDGGHSIRAESKEMNDMMTHAAKILNIKGEYIFNVDKTHRIQLHASCDVEGHLGHDGRHYIVDTARAMPPATPRKDVQGSFLYLLLRPEFLKGNPVALCPDSFSGFFLENREKHNQDIVNATKRLEEDLVPAFARSMEELFAKERKARGALFDKGPGAAFVNNSTMQPPDDDFALVVSLMHRRGINLRYLGLVRSHTTHPAIRRLLLTEMIARLVKHHIRKQLRELQSVDPLAYAETIGQWATKLFGKNTESFVFWTGTVPKELDNRFQAWNSAGEKSANLKQDLVALEALFRRVQTLLGFKFSEAVRQAFPIQWPQIVELERPFRGSDIESLRPVVKHIHRIYFEEGFVLSKMAVAATNVTERDLWFEKARKFFDESLKAKPGDYRSLQNIGYSLFLQATGGRSTDKKLLLRASDMFKQAVDLAPKDIKGMLKWANCLLELSRVEEKADPAEELLKEAFTLFDRAKKAASSDMWKAKVLTQWGNAYLQRTKIPLARQQRLGLLQSSSLDNVEYIANSLECFREAVALGCREFEVLHSLAIAYAKLARTQYGDTAMQTFMTSFQHFTSAAALQNQSLELYYNWGNALYRQSRALLDQHFASPEESGADLGSVKQIIRLSLSDAAAKYSRVLDLKHNFNRAIMNWVKVLKAMAELNKKGSGAMSPVDSRPTAPGESFLSLELKRFLGTFKAAFLKDPKSVSVEPLNDLAQESTEVVVLLLVVHLKDLLGYQRRFPLEKKQDIVRLIERIENRHLPQRRALNSLMSPPSSQDSSFFEGTPPSGLDGLNQDMNVLNNYEVLRRLHHGTLLQIRHNTTLEEFGLKIVPNENLVPNLLRLRTKNVLDPAAQYGLTQPNSLPFVFGSQNSAPQLYDPDAMDQDTPIAEGVTCPFVAPIVGYFADIDRQRTFFMTEWLRSRSVQTLLKKKIRLELNVAQFIIAELILALEYLHSRGIHYKNIRPNKLMIAADGHIELLPPLSFGSDINLFENAPFMAPEVLLGNEDLSKADQWTVGVLLFLFLTGGLPFEGENTDKVVDAVLNQDVQFPTGFSLQAQFFIQSLLKKDPSARLASLRSHPFFLNFDWNALASKTTLSPLQPSLREAFKMDISATILYGNAPSDFVGFTFAGSSFRENPFNKGPDRGHLD